MKFAMQNELLTALWRQCVSFQNRWKLYRLHTGKFGGLTEEEEKSINNILALVDKLQDELAEWDFDSTITGEPYRQGKAAPIMKRYLK